MKGMPLIKGPSTLSFRDVGVHGITLRCKSSILTISCAWLTQTSLCCCSLLLSADTVTYNKAVELMTGKFSHLFYA